MRSRSLRSGLPGSLLCAVLACGAHAQVEGLYAFSAEEILRDTCGLITTNEVLWDGALLIDGEIVRLEYDLFEMELRGQFREVSDSFYLDGSAANVVADVNGAQCLFDLVTVHIDGTTAADSADVFTGTIRVDHTARLERCRCEVWAKFRADRVR